MPKRKTQEEFLEDLERVHGGTIATDDKYVNAKTKLKFRCTICGNKWESTPSCVLRSKQCPRCAGKEHRTQAQFLYDLTRAHGSNIYTNDIFVSTKTKMAFTCNLCGYCWDSQPDHILAGHGCPNCVLSSGECCVSSILQFNSIDCDSQHNFRIRGKIHRLDFVLKDKNNNWCVIQPDGEQHYRLKTAFGGDKEFEHRKQMDKDENKYLSALGIRVLRIPWFWFDLDNTLILLQDFLGYQLSKPNKDYVPAYKKVKDMVYDYLKNGNANNIITKYGVGLSTLSRKFINYFGMSREKYLKLHPEYSNTCIYSIDQDGNMCTYFNQVEASHQTGIGISNINMCINKHGKTAGGYRWERAN